MSNFHDCFEQFMFTIGTLFERSKTPLNKWLVSTYFRCASEHALPR